MMIFTLSVSALGSLLLAILASVGSCRITAPKNITQQCISPRLTPDFNGSDFKNIGVVLFRAFDMFDVFGPLEVLQMLALQEQQMDLHFIAETLDPVTTEPAAMNPFNSSFWPVVPVTNTFNDDIDLDLLLIPGGAGVRAPNLQPVDDYIKRMFPKVKVLMTVCTGSALAARTGVMDGHLATTNKKAWDSMTGWRKEVQWVSPARFVIDGKVWSSSGVTSALDVTFAFIEAYWGTEERDRIATVIEHVPHAWNDDPFAKNHDVPPTNAQPCVERR